VSEEEKKEKVKIPRRVIAARLVIFTAVAAWIMGWLATGSLLHDPFLKSVSRPELGFSGNIIDVLSAWYIITFIIVGVFVAVCGFRFVGRWEKD